MMQHTYIPRIGSYIGLGTMVLFYSILMLWGGGSTSKAHQKPSKKTIQRKASRPTVVINELGNPTVSPESATTQTIVEDVAPDPMEGARGNSSIKNEPPYGLSSPPPTGHPSASMPSNNAATQPPGILPPKASIPNNTPIHTFSTRRSHN